MAKFGPGEEVGIVGFEIDALELQRPVRAALDHALAEQQHPPVEHRGLSLDQPTPMRSNGARLAFGEFPTRRLERKVKLANLKKVSLLAQMSSEPLETMTTEPPIVAETTAPFSTTRPSAIRLGRPISNPCSIVSMCSPSRGWSKACTIPANAATALPVAGSSPMPQPPANMRA